MWSTGTDVVGSWVTSASSTVISASSSKARTAPRSDGAEMISKRFHIARKRLGLNKNEWEPDSSLFVRPSPASDQLSLF